MRSLLVFSKTIPSSTSTSFYFVAPVAIITGTPFDRLITFFQIRFAPFKFARAGQLSTYLLLLAMGICGTSQAKALELQFRILDYKTTEPSNLIPELGDAIRRDFPPGTCVLCNFLPEYGPQFAYFHFRETFSTTYLASNTGSVI